MFAVSVVLCGAWFLYQFQRKPWRNEGYASELHVKCEIITSDALRRVNGAICVIGNPEMVNILICRVVNGGGRRAAGKLIAETSCGEVVALYYTNIPPSSEAESVIAYGLAASNCVVPTVVTQRWENIFAK